MDAKQRRVKVREYAEQKLEALGFPTSIEFELDDGSTVELLHPWLWDDKTQATYEAVQQGADLDVDENGKIITPPRINGEPAPPRVVREARAALGEETHRRFIAGGGSSNTVALAIEAMKIREDHEPDPKDKR